MATNWKADDLVILGELEDKLDGIVSKLDLLKEGDFDAVVFVPVLLIKCLVLRLRDEVVARRMAFLF